MGNDITYDGPLSFNGEVQMGQSPVDTYTASGQISFQRVAPSHDNQQHMNRVGPSRREHRTRTSHEDRTMRKKRSLNRPITGPSEMEQLLWEPIVSFLPNEDLANVARVNTTLHEQYDQTRTNIINSNAVSEHLRDFERRRIQKLVVVVQRDGWEQTPQTTYNIPSLRHLVLTSEPSSDRNRRSRDNVAIPDALRQWMPQLHVLDITELTDWGDIQDVLAALSTTQSPKELRFGTFFLRDIRHLEKELQDILMLIPFLHVTITLNAYEDLSVDDIQWLYAWATQNDPSQNKQRLTLNLPEYNQAVERLFEAFRMRQHANSFNGVDVLRIFIHSVNVEYVENFNPETTFLTKGLGLFYKNDHTKVRFFMHIDNMKANTARWFDRMTSELFGRVNLETVMDLNFTKEWTQMDRYDVNVSAVKKTIRHAIDWHVFKTFVRIRNTNQEINDEDLLSQMPRKPILTINLGVPRQKISEFDGILDFDVTTVLSHEQKPVHEKMVRLGCIKVNVTENDTALEI